MVEPASLSEKSVCGHEMKQHPSVLQGLMRCETQTGFRTSPLPNALHIITGHTGFGVSIGSYSSVLVRSC